MPYVIYIPQSGETAISVYYLDVISLLCHKVVRNNRTDVSDMIGCNTRCKVSQGTAGKRNVVQL